MIGKPFLPEVVSQGATIVPSTYGQVGLFLILRRNGAVWKRFKGKAKSLGCENCHTPFRRYGAPYLRQTNMRDGLPIISTGVEYEKLHRFSDSAVVIITICGPQRLLHSLFTMVFWILSPFASCPLRNIDGCSDLLKHIVGISREALQYLSILANQIRSGETLNTIHGSRRTVIASKV